MSAEGTSQKATSTPHTDDESITTSTESDSLETWTLVNDKNKKNISDTSAVEENRSATNNRIEILTNFDDSLRNDHKEIHESAESRTDDDSNVDEASEGISIISESESAGRASPLATVENLNSVDLNSYSNPEVGSPASMLRLPIHAPPSSYALPPTVHAFDENTLRQRRIRRYSSSTISERKAVKSKNESIVEAKVVHPWVRRGLKGTFFICVALAILAFIGKLRNPDWQPFFDTKNLSVLEQKLTDLELQNNLMRAEIDILSKQVNYLSSLSESGRMNRDRVEREPKRQERIFKQTGEWIMKQKGKNFKTWPDNGDGLDPVEINGELKKPYKCPNGIFVEIGSMCVEKSDENMRNMEDILTVDDIVVEQIVEGIQPLKEESAADSTDHAYVNKPGKSSTKAGPKRDQAEYKTNKYMNTESRNSKEHEHHSSEKKYGTQKHWKQRKHLHLDNDDDDDDFSDEDEEIDDSLEDLGKKKFTSKESYNKREQVRSDGDKYKDRHQNDNFKDRRYNDRSGERRFYGNSKENPSVGSDEQSRKNGEWHGKLMQQRENARRQNEYRHRNKNWFIERGDSREKMRHRR